MSGVLPRTMDTSSDDPRLHPRSDSYTRSRIRIIRSGGRAGSPLSAHPSPHLQGALANRNLLQSTETTAACENLCGHQCQCATGTDLDRLDCHPDSQVPAVESPVRLSNLVALLRQQLFVYRDLYRWIDVPFEAPPALTGIHDAQLALFG
jgi:hypothetical protein